MTVIELVEKLVEYPSDMKVFIDADEKGVRQIDSVKDLFTYQCLSNPELT